MRDGPGLASSVRGMPCCPPEVPGRAHRLAARRASLHHRDLTTHPGAGIRDRFARSRVITLSRLEKVKDVLCARRRPKSQEMVIRITEGPTAANRHEAKVPNLRKDHCPVLPLPVSIQPRGARGTGRVLNHSVVPASERPSVSRGLAGHPPLCTRQSCAFTLRGNRGRSPQAAMRRYMVLPPDFHAQPWGQARCLQPPIRRTLATPEEAKVPGVSLTGRPTLEQRGADSAGRWR